MRQLPYSLGLYQVEHSGTVRGSVDLEDMEVHNAEAGNASLQTRIVMKVKSELSIKTWINFPVLFYGSS